MDADPDQLSRWDRQINRQFYVVNIFDFQMSTPVLITL